MRGRRHNRVTGSRVPVRMRLWPSKMWHALASYLTVYPASQNTAVERSDACVRPGTMWALVAFGRRPGMSISHVCVDWSVAPSGSMIVIGAVATCLLRTGAPCAMKWLVAPVSLMAVAWLCGVVGGVAGPVSSSSSSSSKPVSILKRLGSVVGVAITVEESGLFILISTCCGAPPRQAR